MASTERKESYGRERAIEMLMDMHKDGPAIRVAKIMEEGPAEALAARPIKVTRSMLVDMAHSLSRHETTGDYLDGQFSHDGISEREKDVRATLKTKGCDEEASGIENSQRERIMRHHAKITKAKTIEFRSRMGFTGTALPRDVAVHPPPQLISSLRKIYGISSGDHNLEEIEGADTANCILPDLLQHIFGHKVFGKNAKHVATSDCEGDTDTVQPNTSPIANIESIIGNAFAMEEDDDEFLEGLQIAALCVLTASIKTSTTDDESSRGYNKPLNLHDGKLFYGLQVGGPLSLIFDKVKGANILGMCGGERYLPEEDLVNYFRDSSATYEKRIEIQKTCILGESHQSDMEGDLNPSSAGFDSGSSLGSCPPVLLCRDDNSSSNESIAPINDSGDSEDFEEEERPLSDSNRDSSSGSSGDSEEDDSSSSSDSNINGEDGDDQVVMDEVAEDEAHLLEEALALRLAELNTAIAVVLNTSRIEPGKECSDNGNDNHNEDEIEAAAFLDSKNLGSGPVDAITNNNDDNNRPYDLPSLPSHPDKEWFRSIWATAGEDVGVSGKNIANCFDPAALSAFGKLPASNIFIILLSVIVEVSEKKRRNRTPRNSDYNSGSCQKPKYSKKHELEAMLREKSFGENGKKPVKSEQDFSSLSHILHFTTAMLDQLATARVELFDAICDELLAVDEINSVPDEDTFENSYNTDDPAFTLGGSFAIGTGAQDTSDCLEEKGMVRKAAAAAHIAAIRKKRVETNIRELVELINLMSLGSFLTLRHLRLVFGELSSRCPLEIQQTAMSCEARLRLSTCLSTFTSPNVITKFHERLQKIYMSSDIRRTLFNAMSFKLLLIEATSLWGEAIINLLPNRTLLEQSLLRLLNVASSYGTINGSLIDRHNTENEDMHFAWSEKDEHILKLSAACRRINCSDALDYLLPCPIAQGTHHFNDSSFHVPSAFISALRDAVFTEGGLNKTVTNLCKKCYIAICGRIHTQFFQWGGYIGKTEDLFVQPKPKGEALGFTNLLTGRDPGLVFDTEKCADSIAVEDLANGGPGGPSVNQRANKVWGTVLSSKCFQPKTGVHRWAVKMEKCERGHMFVGVGTSRASMKTYVGGDKHGWGMIGTQALWHDRKKIRNDYGKTFRTGDTIVVTLDTDAGTLGFSLWNESGEQENSSTSSNVDFDLFNAGESETGKLEDWGFAFEGLPLDTRLFPAIGMYQRDDKASLIGLQGTAAELESSAFDAGCCFYPRNLTNIQEWNEGICNQGIYHASSMMNKAVDLLSEGTAINRDVMFGDVLLSLSASLSALPASIPVLSGKIAYNLLPIVLKCLVAVDEKIEDSFKASPPTFTPMSGKWNITVKYSDRPGVGYKKGSIPSGEGYCVDFKFVPSSNNIIHEISGSKSSGGNATMRGICRGNLIQIAETRSGGSDDKSTSFLIDARLNLCGTKFFGTCNNSKYGFSGSIFAEYDDCGSERFPCKKGTQENLVQCSYMLSVAAGRLSLILSQGATIRDIEHHTGTGIKVTGEMKCDLMNLVASSSILASGHRDDGNDSSSCLKTLQKLYEISDDRLTTTAGRTIASWYNNMQNLLLKSCDVNSVSVGPPATTSLEFDRVDAMMTLVSGGVGSLSTLDSSYTYARRCIVQVLLHHTGFLKDLTTLGDEIEKPLASVWIAALNLVESGVRSAIIKPGLIISRATACKEHCEHLQSVSSFLLSFEPLTSQIETQACIEEVKGLYTSISSEEKLLTLRRLMTCLTDQAYLKCIGLSAVQQNLKRRDWTIGGVETMLTGFYSHLSNGYSQEDRSSKSLPTFPGANAIVQNYISSLQMNVYSAIMALIKHPVLSEAFESLVSATVQSLLLTISACFIQSVDGFAHILLDDSLWNFFVRVISNCLIDLKAGSVTQPFGLKQVFSKPPTCTNLDILLAMVRVLHTVLFQLHKLGVESLLPRPFALLKTEILHIVQFVIEQNRSSTDAENTNWAMRDLESRNGAKIPAPIPELEAIKDHFDHHHFERFEFPWNRKAHIGTVQDYMGHLLTCLFTTVRTASSLGGIHDFQFFKRLLKIFLCHKIEKTSESSRYRIRYLRLLRIVLPGCIADDDIVGSLFSLLGNALSDSVQGNIGFIEARETISLIRYLYAHSNWRQIIAKISKQLLAQDKTTQNGVFSFFGGVPGSLVPGSFVLITPTGANSQYSASPGIVTSNQSESLPAGGIEGIVSGLRRKDSKAGVISSLDEVNATCEIVLLDRIDYLRDGDESRSSSNFSVRVERVPVSDITSVDENGLFLDKASSLEILWSFPVNQSLSFAMLSLKENCIDGTHVADIETNYADLALLLRSNIPFLSIPDLCSQMGNGGESKEFMAHLLKLASLSCVRSNYAAANSACGQNLKCLSDFEARYWYLKTLLPNVKRRQTAMKAVISELIASLEENYNIASKKLHECQNQHHLSHLRTPIGSDDNSRECDERRGEELNAGFTEGGASSNHSGSDEENGSEDYQEEDSSSDNRHRHSEGNDELAHLREVAIVQMLELGLPRSWSEFALRRVGGTNIEAAVHFCLERGADMERLIAEEHLQERPTLPSNRRRNVPGVSQLLQQLVDMGFPSHWCAEALSATGQNIDEALTWILTNGERLSALDENGNIFESNSDESDGNDNGNVDIQLQSEGSKESKGSLEKVVKVQKWPDSILCPVRSISGKANIDGKTLEVGGLPSGGFTSVGTKGVLLTKGKWYYECVLVTAGCIQVGWADSSFSGEADRGDGCGDGPSSWAYDGWRRYRWHDNATEWGCRWQEGDVVGCLVDMDCKEIRYTLNGKAEEIGMGLAFSGDGFRPCAGVYACVSFNRKEKFCLLLGGSSSDEFVYSPPIGYRPVAEAFFSSVKELDILLGKEQIISDKQEPGPKSYLCDFSNCEHGHEIFAWQHRYYGSDASVHLGVNRRQHNSASLHGRNSSMYQKGGGADLAVDLMLNDTWEAEPIVGNDDITLRQRLGLILNGIQKSYTSVFVNVYEEYQDVCLALCILYARKSIVHIVSSMSSDLNFRWFCSKSDDEIVVARNFLSVVELCCSLHYEGWVGEASTMSLASEALGLAISSNERSSRGSSLSSVLGRGKRDETNETMGYLSCGYVQMLNYVTMCEDPTSSDCNYMDPSNSLASCAEIAFSGKGIGAVTFLKGGLLNIVMSNDAVVDIMVAYVRRSVRLLAWVQVYHDDKKNHDKNETLDTRNSASNNGIQSEDREPDAKIASFLTGLLMSGPIAQSSFGQKSSQSIVNSLIEAWTVGLLSRSIPWRMVSATTISALLNICPQSWNIQLSPLPTLTSFFERLESTVSRRMWVERAASPVCSRYLQCLIELQSSVNRFPIIRNIAEYIALDASTPQPLEFDCDKCDSVLHWESKEGWVCSDSAWEIWTGTVEYFPVEWNAPGRSAVRSLMDGGKGPPMLREGCTVLRGHDWGEDETGSISGQEDGKEIHEREKERREESKKRFEIHAAPEINEVCREETQKSDEVALDCDTDAMKKMKLSHPKLPLGRVIGIEPWKGVPGKARRVRWDLTGVEGLYRYGGDGGKFDIVHVEVNDKCTRITKRHPHDETSEQCAIRHGFGIARKFNVILRLRKSEVRCNVIDGVKEHLCEGILEWPDFGAGIKVTCRFYEDGAITLTEERLLFGSQDSGWEPRFGQPSFVPGTTITLSTTGSFLNPSIKDNDVSGECTIAHSDFEELLGSTSHLVESLRDRANGNKLRVSSEMRLVRSKLFSIDDDEGVSSSLPPLSFDADWHAPCMSLSEDKRTVTCTSAEGRSSAFLSSGFTKGIHYWEVKIDQAEVGSVYIGVAEKPKSYPYSNISIENRPRLNRWHGWGFVNFRATYNEGTERVYGSHCHAGDIVGVLLDCDSGRLSFFYDGVKYGEHILNDLGCAFENIAPFGFNADGCGGGGAGQGAPSGEGGRGGRYPANGTVRAKSLWPVIGLCHPGDCVTITRKWMTNYGIDGPTMVRNAMLVDEVLQQYCDSKDGILSYPSAARRMELPQWLLKESFAELKRWEVGRWKRAKTRADGCITLPNAGLDIDVDTSAKACAVACARLGLTFVLLPGARLSIKRSAGRILEMSEEAEIVGAFQGKIWYKLISQKSEGGSLMEGGGRAWFWDESDMIEGAFTLIEPESSTCNILLPLLTGKGGLRIEGASGDVYRTDSKPVENIKSYVCPYECATVWMVEYSNFLASEKHAKPRCNISWTVHTLEEFDSAVNTGLLSGVTPLESDSFLAQLLSSIADCTSEGSALDCSYDVFCNSLFNALKNHDRLNETDSNAECMLSDSSFHLAPAIRIANFPSPFPPMKAILARVAMLRALNRRSRYAIPVYSLRPPQEDSSIVGGYCGLGASVECLGKSRITEYSKNWVQAPSTGRRVRRCRRLFFTSVKTDILKSLVKATTTPTSLSHDEYELPRDIRTVRVNRLKARKALDDENQVGKKEHSIFGQMQSELRGWSGNTLRRGYVARGHGGQPRAFKVKLIGEGVNDYSGPYREVFTDAMREVNQTCSLRNLGVLEASPNKEFGIGENRHVNVFATTSGSNESARNLCICGEERALREHYSSRLVTKTEKLRDLEDSLKFLGKLAATAVRHGIPVDLDLPLGTAWMRLCEEDGNMLDILTEIDLLASRRFLQCTEDVCEEKHYITHFLMKQQQMLNHFAEGISSVLPVEVFSLFTGFELKDYFCGNDEVDVELLQKVVEYEGYSDGDVIIRYFWETLREMTTDERKLFLQFVWARSRMPLRERDFDSPFKIQKDTKSSSSEALPTASTCFFTLSLPEYDSKEKLREKLLFAIKHVKTMESDYVTNDAEVGEGWQGF